MEKQLPIGFTLDGIRTEQFATIESAYKAACDVTYSASLSLDLDHEHQRVRVLFGTNFLCEDSPFIIIEVACFFSVDPDGYKSLLDKAAKKVRIPAGFARHLATLTVGTARGVLHVKLEDTKFHDFILPTINVADIVQEDIVFELN